MFKLYEISEVCRSNINCDFNRYTPFSKATLYKFISQPFIDTPKEKSVISLLYSYKDSDALNSAGARFWGTQSICLVN